MCLCVDKDDEPDDGPQHYILLLGFYQCCLIGALDALGVHVSNVIKLSSEYSQTSEGQQEQQTSEGSEKSQQASPDLDAGKGPSVFAYLILYLIRTHIYFFCVCHKQRFMVVKSCLHRPGSWICSGQV